MRGNNIYDFFLENLKTFFYPEEWLDLDLNFSKAELMTLLLIERYGEVSMSQICEDMNMPMSTATGIIDRMVKKELLQRERSESDRRLVVVRLKERGRAVADQWKQVFDRYADQIEAALTDDERRLLFKVFMKIIDIINQKEKTIDDDVKKPAVNKIEIE